MNVSSNRFKLLFLVSFILLFFGAVCPAQNKVDLEVTAQGESETARGGEKFSYTVTVKNIGAEKAENVFVLHTGRAGEVSALPSTGKCAPESRASINLRCDLGDLEPNASATVNFTVELLHFDLPKDGRLPDLPFGIGDAAPDGNRNEPPKSEIASFHAFSHGEDVNTNNNIAQVWAELLPSTNKAPQIEILSHKNEAVLIMPLNKTLEVPLRIKAFDPDGKVVKVRVLEQNFQIIAEDNQYKFVFGGKKYTAQEAEDAGELLAPYFGGDAVRNADGTFSYVWKSLRYGSNRVSVEATDDGGRSFSTDLKVEVKSDATVKIVTPKNEQVLTPGATVSIETTSKISAGITPQIRLLGTQEGFPTSFDELPLMRQVSKTGDTFKHQFLWKIEKEGVYDLRPIVLENGQDTNTTDYVRIIAAYPRVVKIAGVKNGQTFEEDKPIHVRVEALNAKGDLVEDGFELLLDGKPYGEIYNSWTMEPNPPYKKYINTQSGRLLQNLEKGTHTLQVIAKQYRMSVDGATLGKSEIITIIVK